MINKNIILLIALYLQGCSVSIVDYEYSTIEKNYDGIDSVKIYTYTNKHDSEESRGVERNKKIENILLEYSTKNNYTKIKLMRMILTGQDGSVYAVSNEVEDLVNSIDMNPYSKNHGLNRWIYAKGSFPYSYQDYSVKAFLLICRNDDCINRVISGDLKTTTRETKKNTWLRGYG